MATTTNMTLVLPTVSATLGPLWASELNAALTLVDSHDHSTGKGVKITPSGLNINADLPLNSNDLTTVRTVALDSQSATLSASDIRAVYSVLGDLYWNNGSGTPVQITSGASVQSSASTIARAFERLSVNANKTILAADTYSYLDTDTGSSVTYTLPAANAVAAGRFYEFKDATGQAATNNITINRAGADTISGGTSIKITGNYGSCRLVSDGSSKWATDNGYLGQQVSASSGTFTTTSGSFVDVTNLTVTITTSGRPVLLVIQSDGTTSTNTLGIERNSGSMNEIEGYFKILRGATAIATSIMLLQIDSVTATFEPYMYVPASYSYVDVVAAGTYTYKVQAAVLNSTMTLSAKNLKLIAIEL